MATGERMDRSHHAVNHVMVVLWQEDVLVIILLQEMVEVIVVEPRYKHVHVIQHHVQVTNSYSIPSIGRPWLHPGSDWPGSPLGTEKCATTKNRDFILYYIFLCVSVSVCLSAFFSATAEPFPLKFSMVFWNDAGQILNKFWVRWLNTCRGIA